MEFFKTKKKRMNIYENIYIGSFIFELGIIVGRNRQEHYSSVNLFQQTPADKTYGDLLTSVNGKYLLIEFKRKQNSDDKKEKEKAKALTEKSTNIEQVSRQCHFLGIGDENGETCTIEYYPYIDFFYSNPKRYDNFIEKFLGVKTKKIFKPKAQNILKKAVSQIYANPKEIAQIKAKSEVVGVHHDEFKKYLDTLKSIYSGDNSSSVGGIIVCVEEDGSIGLIPTEELGELIKKLDNKINADFINQEKLLEEEEPESSRNRIHLTL